VTVFLVIMLFTIVVSLIDFFLLVSCSSFYFSNGLILYKKSFPYINDLNSIFRENEKSFTKKSNNKGWSPKIKFRIKENGIFIHYKLFELNFGFNKYATPVLHGIIVGNKEQNETTVNGYLNWGIITIVLLPIALVFYFIDLKLPVKSIIIIPIISVVFITVFLYFLIRIDKKKYDEISSIIESINNNT
jgi:hypothetical protein